jgi:hypothetical protein
MIAKQKLIIGSRGSRLSLAQSEHFKDELLLANPDLRPDQIELKVIKTSGDKFKTENLASMGGKGLFVKEIEQELLENNIDCAVHSLKDVPTFGVPSLKLAAFLKRKDERDAFISPISKSFDKLKAGSTVGTSSAAASTEKAAKAAKTPVKKEGFYTSEKFKNKLKLVDDGIKSILDGVRNVYKERKIISVFEPHRYTRVLSLKNEFAKSFVKSDIVILCPLYAAGEKKNTKFNLINFANLISKNSKTQVIIVKNEIELSRYFKKNLISNEIIIGMGAGIISKWMIELKKRL